MARASRVPDDGSAGANGARDSWTPGESEGAGERASGPGDRSDLHLQHITIAGGGASSRVSLRRSGRQGQGQPVEVVGRGLLADVAPQRVPAAQTRGPSSASPRDASATISAALSSQSPAQPYGAHQDVPGLRARRKHRTGFSDYASAPSTNSTQGVSTAPRVPATGARWGGVHAVDGQVITIRSQGVALRPYASGTAGRPGTPSGPGSDPFEAARVRAERRAHPARDDRRAARRRAAARGARRTRPRPDPGPGTPSSGAACAGMAQ